MERKRLPDASETGNYSKLSDKFHKDDADDRGNSHNSMDGENPLDKNFKELSIADGKGGGYRNNKAIDIKCTGSKDEKMMYVDNDAALSTSASASTDSDERDKVGDGEIEEEFDILAENYTLLQHKGMRIAAGFKIDSMSMKDGHSGELIWHSKNFSEIGRNDNNHEMKEIIPKRILNCRAVLRELIFSSREQINKFRIEQRVFFHGTCIEEWFFTFGFVIPGSTNTWEQVIEAAAAPEMIPAEAMSGNVIFESSFFDDNILICKNNVRIYYE